MLKFMSFLLTILMILFGIIMVEMLGYCIYLASIVLANVIPVWVYWLLIGNIITALIISLFIYRPEKE